MVCFGLLVFVSFFFSGLSILLLPGEVWFPRNIFTNFLTFLIPSIEPRRTISGWAVDIADNLDLCLFLLTAIHCKTEIIPLPSLSQVLAVQKKETINISQMLQWEANIKAVRDQRLDIAFPNMV